MTQAKRQASPGTSAPWVLALTSTAQFMGALDALIVSTALRTIKQQLHASVGQLEWTVSAYPPARRGWALGIFSGAVGLAVLSGPVVGGAITQGLAWQWIFLINVPVGIVLIPLAIRRIPESHGTARRSASCCSPPTSAPCSSWPSFRRRPWARTRSAPGYGCCRGPLRCSSSGRAPERSRTAPASGP